MNCKEFQFYLSERNALGEAAAAEHTERCPECRSLSLAQDELVQCLGALRESAPQLPASVDTAVMNAFRREKGSRANITMATRFAWVPVAAALLIAGALWLVRGERQAVSSASVAKTDAPAEVQAPRVPNKIEEVAEVRPSQNTVRPHRHVTKHAPAETEPKLASAEQQTPVPGFRNLMYCDPISCSGAMQVIRIQVPVMVQPFPTARPSSGVVQADVVVGADGVARAIRFVR